MYSSTSVQSRSWQEGRGLYPVKLDAFKVRENADTKGTRPGRMLSMLAVWWDGNRSPAPPQTKDKEGFPQQRKRQNESKSKHHANPIKNNWAWQSVQDYGLTHLMLSHHRIPRRSCSWLTIVCQAFNFTAKSMSRYTDVDLQIYMYGHRTKPATLMH